MAPRNTEQPRHSGSQRKGGGQQPNAIKGRASPPSGNKVIRLRSETKSMFSVEKRSIQLEPTTLKTRHWSLWSGTRAVLESDSRRSWPREAFIDVSSRSSCIRVGCTTSTERTCGIDRSELQRELAINNGFRIMDQLRRSLHRIAQHIPRRHAPAENEHVVETQSREVGGGAQRAPFSLSYQDNRPVLDSCQVVKPLRQHSNWNVDCASDVTGCCAKFFLPAHVDQHRPLVSAL